MAQHNKKGRLGEDLALNYLISSGFEIMATNFRHGKAEIDIIFKEADVLVFVEVKTRTSNKYGAPEVAINDKKQRLISSAASAFMEQINYSWKIRFDVISIIAENGDRFNLEHFRDAFYW